MRTTHAALFANNAIPMLVEHIDHLDSLFWLNGERRVMHVHSVKCMMEGAGALIAYGSNDDNTLQGVIDIGGQTTDLFLAKGQRPLSNLSRAKRLGW